jgi:sugar/nucleoside kinase (ribokinase family)
MPAKAGIQKARKTWTPAFECIQETKDLMLLREGFALAGAWMIEHERIVAQYPAEGNRAHILEERRFAGGDIFHLAGRLRARAANLPLYAIGCVGEDDDGHAVLSGCHRLEVDTYQLQAIAGLATAHAEIIHSNDNGSRTSYYFAGANAALGLAHFDFRHCLARWFHLGEVYLLAQLAQRDEEAGTITGRVLQAARSAGLITSLALATGAEGFYGENGGKVFAQTDYLFLHAEALGAIASHLSGSSRNAAHSSWEALARDLLEQGVSSGVGIYSAEKGLSVLRDRESRWYDFSSPVIQLNDPPPAQSRSATAFLAEFLSERYSELVHAQDDEV